MRVARRRSLRDAAAGARAAIVAVVLLVLAGCAALPADEPRTVSHAWPRPDETTIGRTVAPAAAQHPGASGLRLLASGVDAFAARIALSDLAERTLDLQYYIVRDDDTTAALLSRVVLAADRGVRVRLLVDDVGAVGRDSAIAAFARHRNIEVRLFNPFARRGPLGLGRLLEFLGDGARLNHRMHNKLFVADNASAIIGGRNLGNEYFAADPQSAFVDLDVLAVGPVVAGISASFDDYWASAWAIPIEAFLPSGATDDEAQRVLTQLRDVEERVSRSPYAARLRTGSIAQALRAGHLPFVWASAEALHDAPDKPGQAGAVESPIRARLRALLDGARTDVLLVSPYFVPGVEGVDALRVAEARGVAVRILTNSLASTDVAAAYAGYARYQPALLSAGIELYELRPVGGSASGQERLAEALGAERAALHAKAVVVDRRHVLVGSMNLDPRSDRLNTEIGVLVDSPELARELLGRLEALTTTTFSYRLTLADGHVRWITTGEDGREAPVDAPPDAAAWRRLLLPFLRTFAPERLL